MARYDKYEPHCSLFRAPLEVDTVAGEEKTPFAVGLNANGRVVKGAGQTGVIGIYIAHGPLKAGEIADVMTGGEIVELEGLAAGTRYYGSATGTLTTTDTDYKLGFTVEAGRLIVRAGV